MDYITTGAILLVLFFTLRTNYKISDYYERHKKKNASDGETNKKVYSNLLIKTDSLEKRIVILQKMLKEIKEETYEQSGKNLKLVQDEIAQIKSDTDIIKSLFLKQSVKQDIVKISDKDENTSAQLDEESTQEIEKSNINLGFDEKIKEKLSHMDANEIWLLKQIVEKEPESWHSIGDFDYESSTAQFQIPKMSRKLIVDGLPILKIKNVSDKMLIKWGEGLTSEKKSTILEEIRGEGHVIV